MSAETPSTDATPLPPGASLFFASERFVSPLFSFPPSSEADDQELTSAQLDHSRTSTSSPTTTTTTASSSTATRPPLNQPMQFLQLHSMRARPRQRLMELAREAWTLPSTTIQETQQPSATAPSRQRRVLRPNYAVTVSPSLFSIQWAKDLSYRKLHLFFFYSE